MPSKIIKPPDICFFIRLYYESTDVLNPLYPDELVKINLKKNDNTSLKKLIRASVSLTANIPVSNLTSSEIQERILNVVEDSSVMTLTNLMVEIYDFMEENFIDSFPKMKKLQKQITHSWIYESVIYKSCFYFNGISDKVIPYEHESIFLKFINKFIELEYRSNLEVNASFYNYEYMIHNNMPVSKSTLQLFLKQRESQFEKLIKNKITSLDIIEEHL